MRFRGEAPELNEKITNEWRNAKKAMHENVKYSRIILPKKKKENANSNWDAANEMRACAKGIRRTFGWMKMRAKSHGWGALKLKYSKGRLRLCYQCHSAVAAADTLIKRRRRCRAMRMYSTRGAEKKNEKKKKHPKQIIPSESQWLVVSLAIVWVWSVLLVSRAHHATTMRVSARYSFPEQPLAHWFPYTILLRKQQSNFLIASSCFA